MQHGYVNFPLSRDHDARHEELPRRAIAPGLHMGLSVLLNVSKNEYYCSGTESVGFKALMHAPITLPEMVEYGFAIEPGTETFFAVDPTAIHADEDIYDVNYHKRQCYLADEKPLAYFRHYSFLNCFMECTSNYTYEHCGCVAYYMPRNPTRMPICQPSKSICVDEAVTKVEEAAFEGAEAIDEGKPGEAGHCECLPGCTDLEFPHESSVSTLTKETMTHQAPGTTDEVVKENLAMIHIYFKHQHFLQRKRGQLYGVLDFFSNIGGLLGLCLGLSAVSVVEFLYFFTMRLFFNNTMNRKEEF